MIKVFRNIRQNMLSQGKNGKPALPAGRYLKYAFGEIVLVVLGILIALSINNWNENRKERAQELAILRQLRTEFNSNLDQLDQKITIRKEKISSTLKLFNFIDHPGQRTKDSIDMHVGRTLTYTTFDPIVNDLASSGNLRLIKNDSLKQYLSFWTSEFIQVKEDENAWLFYRNEIYVPFLVQYYQLRTIRNKILKSNVMDAHVIEGSNIEDASNILEIGMSKHKEDFNVFLDHPDYEDHLERCFGINSFVNVQSQVLRKRIVSILDLLNQEINK